MSHASNERREDAKQLLRHYFEKACPGLVSKNADVSAELGDLVRAARLVGAAESLRRAGGGVVQPAEAAAREAALAAIHRALPVEQVEAALEAGRGLSLDDAATEAMGNPRAM